jgi:hypothetical protein
MMDWTLLLPYGALMLLVVGMIVAAFVLLPSEW